MRQSRRHTDHRVTLSWAESRRPRDWICSGWELLSRWGTEVFSSCLARTKPVVSTLRWHDLIDSAYNQDLIVTQSKVTVIAPEPWPLIVYLWMTVLLGLGWVGVQSVDVYHGSIYLPLRVIGVWLKEAASCSWLAWMSPSTNSRSVTTGTLIRRTWSSERVILASCE